MLAVIGEIWAWPVLVTSREALNVAPERRFALAPLALPPVRQGVSVTDVETTAAPALFIDAARRRDRGFDVTADTAPLIAQTCARLDGLPLALELAASRTESSASMTSPAGWHR